MDTVDENSNSKHAVKIDDQTLTINNALPTSSTENGKKHQIKLRIVKEGESVRVENSSNYAALTTNDKNAEDAVNTEGMSPTINYTVSKSSKVKDHRIKLRIVKAGKSLRIPGSSNNAKRKKNKETLIKGLKNFSSRYYNKKLKLSTQWTPPVQKLKYPIIEEASTSVENAAKGSKSGIIKMHKCIVCGSGFAFKSTLVRHMQQHTGGKLFKCVYCCKRLSSKHSLKYHISSRHSKDKSFQCDICGYLFRSRSQLDTHYASRHKVGTKITCSQETPSNGENDENSRRDILSNPLLDENSVSINESDQEPFRKLRQRRCNYAEQLEEILCEICSKEFKSELKFNKHTQIHSKAKPLKCRICAEKFRCSSQLSNHFTKYHPEEAPFECGKCGGHFYTNSKLSHHSKRKCTAFKCYECSKIFYRKTSIIIHMKSHFPENHKCSRCCKVLTSERYLNVHIQNHVSKPRKECVQCGYTFPNGDTLAEHITARHADSETYDCFQCTRSLREKSHLTKHIQNHEPKNVCQPCRDKYDLDLECVNEFTSDSTNSIDLVCDICAESYTVESQSEPLPNEDLIMKPSSFEQLVQVVDQIYATNSDVTSTNSEMLFDNPTSDFRNFPNDDARGNVENDEEKLSTDEKTRNNCTQSSEMKIEPSSCEQLLHVVEQILAANSSNSDENSKMFIENSTSDSHKVPIDDLIGISKAKSSTNEKSTKCGNEADSNNNSDYETNFSCNTCSKKFLSLAKLCKHSREHSDKHKKCRNSKETRKIPQQHNPIGVKIASDHKKISFDNSADSSKPLKSTKESKPRDLEKLQCGICPKLLFGRISLVKHLEGHWKSSLYKCLHCDKQFVTKKTLKQHTKTHTTQCGECFKKYEDESSLIDHLRRHSGKQYTCHHCSKTFSHKSVLELHLKVHSGEKLECSICGKILSNKYTHAEHIKLHLGVKYDCLECGRQLSTRFRLTQHINRFKHSTFICSVCNKYFIDQSSLERHIRGRCTMKHQCYNCGKFVSSKYIDGNLTAHIRCNECKAPQTIGSTLKGEKMSMKICPTCGKGFKSICYLKEHQTIHTGEKLYQCENCFSRFRFRPNFARHVSMKTCVNKTLGRKKISTKVTNRNEKLQVQSTINQAKLLRDQYETESGAFAMEYQDKERTSKQGRRKKAMPRKYVREPVESEYGPLESDIDGVINLQERGGNNMMMKPSFGSYTSVFTENGTPSNSFGTNKVPSFDTFYNNDITKSKFNYVRPSVIKFSDTPSGINIDHSLPSTSRNFRHCSSDQNSVCNTKAPFNDTTSYRPILEHSHWNENETNSDSETFSGSMHHPTIGNDRYEEITLAGSSRESSTMHNTRFSRFEPEVESSKIDSGAETYENNGTRELYFYLPSTNKNMYPQCNVATHDPTQPSTSGFREVPPRPNLGNSDATAHRTSSLSREPTRQGAPEFSPANESLFQCIICGLKLEDLPSLNKHVDVHSSNDRFALRYNDKVSQRLRDDMNSSGSRTVGRPSTASSVEEVTQVVSATRSAFSLYRERGMHECLQQSVEPRASVISVGSKKAFPIRPVPIKIEAIDHEYSMNRELVSCERDSGNDYALATGALNETGANTRELEERENITYEDHRDEDMNASYRMNQRAANESENEFSTSQITFSQKSITVSTAANKSLTQKVYVNHERDVAIAQLTSNSLSEMGSQGIPGSGFHECNVCHSQYKLWALLERHLKATHIRGNHICEICGKWFTNKRNLTAHIAIHSQTICYVCRECNSKYQCKSSLFRHRAKKHGQSNPNLELVSPLPANPGWNVGKANIKFNCSIAIGAISEPILTQITSPKDV